MLDDDEFCTMFDVKPSVVDGEKGDGIWDVCVRDVSRLQRFCADGVHCFQKMRGACVEATLYCVESYNRVSLRRKGCFIERSIDLHGMFLNEAREVVVNFITDSYVNEIRDVLIVTGWGKNSGGSSIIRDSFLNWVEVAPLVNMISKCQQAPREFGGRGAFRLLLKVNRGR